MPERLSLRPQHVTPRPLAAIAALLGLTPSTAGADPVVTGVTHDSLQVRPGDLYAALPGARTHGGTFAAAAAAAGAVAVLTDSAGAEMVSGLPTLVVAEPRTRLGEVAAHVYGQPARDLLMFGVTGTNGKTTTAYLLESGLRAAGHRTGLLGTVETRVGDQRVASVRTTPEATDVHALLAVMRERGVTACAMEVSSHALVYGRVNGIGYDVVGFTNLSQDHLDFHADLDEYFAAKADLFTAERARRGVVCVDDVFGRTLADRSTRSGAVPIATFATQSTGVAATASADWRVTAREVAADGSTRAQLEHRDGRRFPVTSPIPGEFNVANAALAILMLVEAGVEPAVAARGVAACPGVPGRMQRVPGKPDDPLVVVDYAHTPDAVETVLQALRPSTKGRLVVVIGAGGDRDSRKRPLMGAAAARFADVVVVTDDNPRSEDPEQIRAAVLAGAKATPGESEIVEVGDRREAIRAGLETAVGPDDTVVVVGKGHEQGQEIEGVVHPFDDRVVLRQLLRERDDRRGDGHQEATR